MAHIPIRQCVVCRRKRNKRSLVRIVKSAHSGILVDDRQVLPGRGLYVCRTAECFQEFRNKNMLKTIWNCTVLPDFYTDLAMTLKKDNIKDAANLIGFAVRSGKAVLGATALERGIKRKKVFLVIVDRMAGDTTRKRINAISSQNKIPVFEFSGERALADIVGKPNCRSVGICNTKFSRSILNLIGK